MHWTGADIAAAAAAATAACSAAYFVWRKVIKRTLYFLDDYFGTEARPGVPARPGVMERLEAIESQLRPNGGTSMHDAVSRIEQQISQAATAQPATVVNVHAGKEPSP